MSRPGGNPDFGVKHRFDYGREEPLSEQVKVLMHSKMKEELKNIAEYENCTVPDLVRAALEQYLATKKQSSYSADKARSAKSGV